MKLSIEWRRKDDCLDGNVKCFTGAMFITEHADGKKGVVAARFVRKDDNCEASCEACARTRGVFVIDKRSHKNTKRLTARERTVVIIKAGALAADIERQLQLHAKAALKRKAKR